MASLSPALAQIHPLHIPEPVSILQGEGKGYLSQKKMVTIPAGSVLAFRVAQLLIDPKWGEWPGASLEPRLCDREAGKLEGFS